MQELQMDPGTMGPGELTEDFDYMEAGSEGDESGWYEMFFNEFGRPPVDIKELQLFIDQSDISPTDVAQGGGQGQMMAAHGGSVMGKDEYDEELNRPQMFLGGALGLGALLGLGKLLGGRRKRGSTWRRNKRRNKKK